MSSLIGSYPLCGQSVDLRHTAEDEVPTAVNLHLYLRDTGFGQSTGVESNVSMLACLCYVTYLLWREVTERRSFLIFGRKHCKHILLDNICIY